MAKRSPSTSRSPATNARASPSSPGAQRIRRTASADRTRRVPRASSGPSALPSQNSTRTGDPVPTSASRSGAAVAATVPGAGAGPGTGAGSGPGDALAAFGPGGPVPVAGARPARLGLRVRVESSRVRVVMIDLLCRVARRYLVRIADSPGVALDPMAGGCRAAPSWSHREGPARRGQGRRETSTPEGSLSGSHPSCAIAWENAKRSVIPAT